jgi:hypothetical protein
VVGEGAGGARSHRRSRSVAGSLDAGRGAGGDADCGGTLGARYEAMTQYYAGASSSLPPQAVQALGERYEAMAEHYLGAGSGGYSPQALRALGERWQAVARYEQQAQLEQARRQAAAFSWADAGIGALAAIGAVALLGLGALGIRSHGERSASPAAS